MVLQKFKVNRYDIVSSITLEPIFQTINTKRFISITKISQIVIAPYHQ